MAALEEGARRLTREEADDRDHVCGVLRQAQSHSNNLTKPQRAAVMKMGRCQEIAILPADKGNATVVMRKKDYNSRMKTLLDSSTYQVLRKDLATTLKHRIGHKLRELVKQREMSESLYPMLRT